MSLRTAIKVMVKPVPELTNQDLMYREVCRIYGWDLPKLPEWVEK